MRIIEYGSGTEEDRRHRKSPWIPGAAFGANPNLEPLLLALEASGIETAEEFARRITRPRFNVPGGYIEVTQDPSGAVNVRGVDRGITHHARLVVQPDVSNVVLISLTPMSAVDDADVVPGSEEDLIRRGL